MHPNMHRCGAGIHVREVAKIVLQVLRLTHRRHKGLGREGIQGSYQRYCLQGLVLASGQLVRIVNRSIQRCLVDTVQRYFGANIPGKPREPMNFMGGMPAYRQRLVDSQDNGYQGFVLAH